MIVPGSKLVIFDPTNSDTPTEVGIATSIPISINIAVADVREPSKRDSSFSKTITIPGGPTVNKLFEHIFDVTTELVDFNPNLKTTCEYYVRSERIFVGDIQLLRIIRKGKSPSIELAYEVSIVGRLANVFLDLGNALVEDLYWSDLNYAHNQTNIEAMFTPTLGVGLCMPYIDYGVTGGNTNVWNIYHLKPAIFEKEYIDRIFASIGKTYTSTFLTGSYYERIINPDINEGALKMTQAQKYNLSFYAGKNATNTYSFPLVQTGSVWLSVIGNGVLSQLPFNVDNVAPFYDPSAQYNTGTSFFIPAPIFGCDYKINLVCFFEVRIVPPSGGSSPVITNTYYNFDIDIYDGTGGNGSIVTQSVSTTAGTGWTPFSVSAEVSGILLGNNSTIEARVLMNDPNFFLTTFTGGAGNGSIEVRFLSTSYFGAQPSSGNLPYNYTVDIASTVPKNVKQIDYLMSIIKAENLYMELDPNDSNNYIIEQREDFFQEDASNTLDWTDKWDYENETIVTPMGDLEAREYLFTYKKDNDKYNQAYFNEYGEVYGQEQIYVNNDFVRNVKKTELIFAPTPNVGNGVNNIVCPVLAKANGNALAPMTCQPRRLYWGGLIDCDAHYWKGTPMIYTPPRTQYPYAGHVDFPYLPTIDLHFDNPKKLYYSYPNQVFTTNNLYLRNWQKFIEQITDANSKVVTMWLYLKASDIANFSFRKRIWIHDSYYIVNKIFDYNPQDLSLTKVELLRLAYVDTPVAEQINNNGGGSGGGNYNLVFQEQGMNDPFYNFSVGDGIANGNGNINNGDNSNILGGSGNMIGQNSFV